MKPIRRRFIGICILLLISGIAAWGVYVYVEGVKCRRVIRSLVHGATYERQVNGRYPVSIGTLLSDGLYEPAMDGTWERFAYINWDKMGVPSPNDDYPIIYDRKYSNHGGFGINVGTVGKRVFWDAGGKWMMNFMEKHPEFPLPTPGR